MSCVQNNNKPPRGQAQTADMSPERRSRRREHGKQSPRSVRVGRSRLIAALKVDRAPLDRREAEGRQLLRAVWYQKRDILYAEAGRRKYTHENLKDKRPRSTALSRARAPPFSIYVWTKQDPMGHARSRRGTSQRDVRRAICMQGHEAPHMRDTSKRVCTHARAAACTIRAAAVAKMGRGARCSSSVSVSRAARAGVTRPAGGG